VSQMSGPISKACAIIESKSISNLQRWRVAATCGRFDQPEIWTPYLALPEVDGSYHLCYTWPV